MAAITLLLLAFVDASVAGSVLIAIGALAMPQGVEGIIIGIAVAPFAVWGGVSISVMLTERLVDRIFKVLAVSRPDEQVVEETPSLLEIWPKAAGDLSTAGPRLLPISAHFPLAWRRGTTTSQLAVSAAG